MGSKGAGEQGSGGAGEQGSKGGGEHGSKGATEHGSENRTSEIGIGNGNWVYLKYFWIDGTDRARLFPEFDNGLYKHPNVGFVHIHLAFEFLHAAGNVLPCRALATQYT